MIAVQRVLPDTLSEIVRRQPLTPAKVDFAWRTAVGPALARVSSARLDGDGTLRVRTTTIGGRGRSNGAARSSAPGSTGCSGRI